MRLVIVGGVAAGTKAASRARRLDPEMEITVYQEEPEPSISECGLPYFLSGVVGERERLIARTPEKFAEKDIEVLVRHRVESIDAATQDALRARPEDGRDLRRHLRPARRRDRRAGHPPSHPRCGPRRRLRPPLPHRLRQDQVLRRKVLSEEGSHRWRGIHRARGRGEPVPARDGGLPDRRRGQGRPRLRSGGLGEGGGRAGSPRRRRLHRREGRRVHRRRPRAGREVRGDGAADGPRDRRRRHKAERRAGRESRGGDREHGRHPGGQTHEDQRPRRLGRRGLRTRRPT